MIQFYMADDCLGRIEMPPHSPTLATTRSERPVVDNAVCWLFLDMIDHGSCVAGSQFRPVESHLPAQAETRSDAGPSGLDPIQILDP